MIVQILRKWANLNYNHREESIGLWTVQISTYFQAFDRECNFKTSLNMVHKDSINIY